MSGGREREREKERELMCASVCVWMYEGLWAGWSQARRICRCKEGEELVCGVCMCVWMPESSSLLLTLDSRSKVW